MVSLTRGDCHYRYDGVDNEVFVLIIYHSFHFLQSFLPPSFLPLFFREGLLFLFMALLVVILTINFSLTIWSKLVFFLWNSFLYFPFSIFFHQNQSNKT